MRVFRIKEEIQKTVNRVDLKLVSAGYGEVPPGWNGRVHTPPDSRLYRIIEGSFTIVSPEGKETVLKEGNTYLIPSGYSFSFTSDVYVRHVFFHIRLCSVDWIDLLGKLKEPLVVNNDTVPDPKPLIDAQDSVDSLLLISVLQNTVYRLLSENAMSLEISDYSTCVKLALEYIKSNLSANLTAKTIAQNCYVATPTLSKKFKEEIGMPIGKYIDRLVIERAEQLIVSSKMSVLEISETLGFCDQFYFSKRFKEKFGMSPLKYRSQPTM